MTPCTHTNLILIILLLVVGTTSTASANDDVCSCLNEIQIGKYYVHDHF